MSRKHAVVSVSWLSLPPALTYPIANKFTTTGYREIDGPEGIFSVHLESARFTRRAQLGREMTSRLSSLVFRIE